MEKTNDTFFVKNTESFKNKMLNWVNRFNIFCLLDNNQYEFEKATYECILAAGAAKFIELKQPKVFSELKKFSIENPGWLFGHFNYPSTDKNDIDFPDAYFFVPEILIKLSQNSVCINSDKISPELIFAEIENQSEKIQQQQSTKINIQNRIDEAEYVEKIAALKKHIQRGDCYEINFCQEFFSLNAQVDPSFLYHQLKTISPNPFSAFYKLEDKFCMCASPERFLKKTGNKIISQPIKGTSKRVTEDKIKDEASKSYLINSEKEKSENVMIVDLVRNDMSRFCKEASVKVTELFGIYSFPQVHQMISTIEGLVDEDIHWTKIVESCYPMGSMTGAPKIRVMELIEKYETVPRGLFSGSIGYISPEGDFDFNVVIRSLFYNETKKLLSFNAGGGITFYSEASQEYQESLIKASAIKNVLETSAKSGFNDLLPVN